MGWEAAVVWAAAEEWRVEQGAMAGWEEEEGTGTTVVEPSTVAVASPEAVEVPVSC